MQNEEINTLVKRITELSDRQSFTQLYQYYAPRIHGFLIKSGVSPPESDEITQETMLILWQKSHLFDPEKSSLSTWLFRVSRNKRIDRLRRKTISDIDVTDPSLMPEPEIAVDTQMDAAQWELKIREALNVLPTEQRKLIRLSFFDGLTHKEISEQSGIPLGTVKSRIRLAFAKLRNEVEMEYHASAE